VRIGRVGDELHLEFEAEEAGLMTVLAHQFADVVRDPELDDAPLLAMLFPDAYRNDADAASEFHRYTRDELEQRKIEAAERIAGSAHEGLVVLDADEAETWVRALTGIRMMVGTRLGIRDDGDEPATGPLAEIYQWLGELQWVLVDGMEGS
jgi:hypothetical protein